jgi:argininosuccinate lyase
MKTQYLIKTAQKILRIAAVVLIALATTPFAAIAEDRVPPVYRHMVDINKAQIVMLAEQGLMAPETAGKLVEGLQAAMEQENPPGANRPLDPHYMQLEQWLVSRIGEDASNIHQGRSRNDLGATQNRMRMREWTLEILEELSTIRHQIQRLAADHVHTVMPGFTHAVQAQPSTLGHFLLAFDAGLERDSDRLREYYRRLNQSPLGSAAFNTSGFPLDRQRLSDLLGFDAPIANSHDAIMVSIVDSKVEFTQHLALSALGIGRFTQYVLFQYDDPVPGIALEGAIVTRSSIMPQKRSPSAIERLRSEASDVVGLSVTSAFWVHNTPMYEVKDSREHHFIKLDRFFEASMQMYSRLQEVLGSLLIRTDILRDKVDGDFSTMTELADTLMREADVPFRIGHHVASELTTYGREHGIVPKDLPFSEVDRIFREATGEPIPLTEEQVARALDPAEFIYGRRGFGGPQPESMQLLISSQKAHLEDVEAWTLEQRQAIANASAMLEEAAEALKE